MSHDVDDPEQDSNWNRTHRRETEMERLDRNWSDLLQELRVAQTGVQLLTGLLLTVPFQARFVELALSHRIVYLVAVSLSAISTALLIAPVVMHRVLFRQHARRTLVSAAQRFALSGLIVLGVAVVAVIVLIFDVVVGPLGAVIAGVVTFLVFAALWGVTPMLARARTGPPDDVTPIRSTPSSP